MYAVCDNFGEIYGFREDEINSYFCKILIRNLSLITMDNSIMGGVSKGRIRRNMDKSVLCDLLNIWLSYYDMRNEHTDLDIMYAFLAVENLETLYEDGQYGKCEYKNGYRVLGGSRDNSFFEVYDWLIHEGLVGKIDELGKSDSCHINESKEHRDSEILGIIIGQMGEDMREKVEKIMSERNSTREEIKVHEKELEMGAEDGPPHLLSNDNEKEGFGQSQKGEGTPGNQETSPNQQAPPPPTPPSARATPGHETVVKSAPLPGSVLPPAADSSGKATGGEKSATSPDKELQDTDDLDILLPLDDTFTGCHGSRCGELEDDDLSVGTFSSTGVAATVTTTEIASTTSGPGDHSATTTNQNPGEAKGPDSTPSTQDPERSKAGSGSQVPTETKIEKTDEPGDTHEAGPAGPSGNVEGEGKQPGVTVTRTTDSGLGAGPNTPGLSPGGKTIQSSSISGGGQGGQTIPKTPEAIPFVNKMDNPSQLLTPYLPTIPVLMGISITTYLLWKYFALPRKRKRHRRAHQVSGPPSLGEQLLAHVDDQTDGPHAYTLVKKRRQPRSAPTRTKRSKKQSIGRPVVGRRTIIDIHLEVLNECQKGDLHLTKEDFFEILVQEFMGSNFIEEEKVPKENVPKRSVTKEDIPVGGVPKEQDPSSGFRVFQRKRFHVSDSGFKEEDFVPKEGVPKEEVPEEGVPKEGVPEEGVPEEQVQCSDSRFRDENFVLKEQVPSSDSGF
ncbi:SICA antigen [Plasmodium coatneyi]|uniref:SICA antigen n=1 Tax=Plasmodium coatneyi TaxID=208452 RepID=A0A1B1DTI8_9APIC|nr:SICA antigen [Plasmodium coatneyi]ANQ06090.1 SICA antigen [Plasmodium coatneyi]